jgi:hypothetical protein
VNPKWNVSVFCFLSQLQSKYDESELTVQTLVKINHSFREEMNEGAETPSWGTISVHSLPCQTWHYILLSYISINTLIHTYLCSALINVVILPIYQSIFILKTLEHSVLPVHQWTFIHNNVQPKSAMVSPKLSELTNSLANLKWGFKRRYHPIIILSVITYHLPFILTLRSSYRLSSYHWFYLIYLMLCTIQ